MTQATFALTPDGTTQYFNLPFTAQSVEVNNQCGAIVSLYRNDAVQTLELQAGAGQDIQQNITNGTTWRASSASPTNGPVTFTFSDQPVSPSSSAGPSAVQYQRFKGIAANGNINIPTYKYRWGQIWMAPTGLPANPVQMNAYSIAALAGGVNFQINLNQETYPSTSDYLRANFGQSADIHPTGTMGAMVDNYLGDSITLNALDTVTLLGVSFYYDVVMVG